MDFIESSIKEYMLKRACLVDDHKETTRIIQSSGVLNLKDPFSSASNDVGPLLMTTQILSMMQNHNEINEKNFQDFLELVDNVCQMSPNLISKTSYYGIVIDVKLKVMLCLIKDQSKTEEELLHFLDNILFPTNQDAVESIKDYEERAKDKFRYAIRSERQMGEWHSEKEWIERTNLAIRCHVKNIQENLIGKKSITALEKIAEMLPFHSSNRNAINNMGTMYNDDEVKRLFVNNFIIPMNNLDDENSSQTNSQDDSLLVNKNDTGTENNDEEQIQTDDVVDKRMRELEEIDNNDSQAFDSDIILLDYVDTSVHNNSKQCADETNAQTIPENTLAMQYNNLGSVDIERTHESSENTGLIMQNDNEMIADTNAQVESENSNSTQKDNREKAGTDDALVTVKNNTSWNWGASFSQESQEHVDEFEKPDLGSSPEMHETNLNRCNGEKIVLSQSQEFKSNWTDIKARYKLKSLKINIVDVNSIRKIKKNKPGRKPNVSKNVSKRQKRIPSSASQVLSNRASNSRDHNYDVDMSSSSRDRPPSPTFNTITPVLLSRSKRCVQIQQNDTTSIITRSKMNLVNSTIKNNNENKEIINQKEIPCSSKDPGRGTKRKRLCLLNSNSSTLTNNKRRVSPKKCSRVSSSVSPESRKSKSRNIEDNSVLFGIYSLVDDNDE